MALGSVILSLFISLGVKLWVTSISIWIVYQLGRATAPRGRRRHWVSIPDDQRGYLRIIWYSCVLFLISEITCGIEVWILLESSDPLTAIHSLASGLAIGLFAFGIFGYLDDNYFHLARRGKCFVASTCDKCTLGSSDRCKLGTIFQLLILFVPLAAVPPLLVSTAPNEVDLSQYQLPFESWNQWFDTSVVPWIYSVYPDYDPTGKDFTMPVIQQVMDFRVVPGLALVMGLVAIGLIRACRYSFGLRLGAAAMGVLSFSYLELIIYRTSTLVLLGALEHEVSELWFLIVLLVFLKRTFPPLPKEAPAARSPGS